MKKVLALALASIMLLSLFGCGNGEVAQSQEDKDPISQEENNDATGQQEENGRSKAKEFTFVLVEDEERVVADLVFDEDVTVSGDFGIIVFENCEFNGDIISTAEQFTRVILSDGTTVNGNCVFKNTVQEASMDYPMPKFISAEPFGSVSSRWKTEKSQKIFNLKIRRFHISTHQTLHLIL